MGQRATSSGILMLMGQTAVVFHVLNELSPGGAESFVVQMLRYHDHTKYYPVCICCRNPVNSHLEQKVQELGVPLHFLKVSEVRLGWVRNPQLDGLYKKYRPAVVHTHLGGLSYTWTLSMIHRTPVRIHTIHNVAFQEMGGGVSRRVRVMAFRYRIGGVVPVAIAEEVARTFEQLYGYKNPPLIPNGIPVSDYAPNLTKRTQFRLAHDVEPDATVIVHVGRFSEQKNHPLLLRAFACVQSKAPLHLWLVGDGELRPAMEQLARELGIASHVRFWGVRSDVADVLNAADIFTLPSKYEGNPMSVMEAMAAGLPVVATAVGGVPELIEEGVSGFLTPNENVDALATALQRLVDNVELRKQMGEAASRRACEKFDIRHTMRAYEALYEQCLSQRLP